MEKYNVMTVLNGDYFEFGKMFVNSFYDVMNVDRLHKLYIFDTGLSEKNRDYFAGFPKLEIMPTTLTTKHTNLHDEDWCKNVYSKTAYLLSIVEQDQLPTMMIDSDCMFVKDFTDILPEDKDFIVCRRDSKESFCEYIASFFGVMHIEQAKAFIDEWREEMYFGTENHKESPALSRLVHKKKYDLSEMNEDVISCTKAPLDQEVYIVHMKSSETLWTVEQRIKQPHLLRYCDKYLTPTPLLGKEAFIKKHGDTEDNKGALLGSLTPAQRALLLQKLKKI